MIASTLIFVHWKFCEVHLFVSELLLVFHIIWDVMNHIFGLLEIKQGNKLFPFPEETWMKYLNVNHHHLNKTWFLYKSERPPAKRVAYSDRDSIYLKIWILNWLKKYTGLIAGWPRLAKRMLKYLWENEWEHNPIGIRKGPVDKQCRASSKF